MPKYYGLTDRGRAGMAVPTIFPLTVDYANYIQFVNMCDWGMLKGEYAIDNGVRLGMLTPLWAQRLKDEFYPKKEAIVIPDQPDSVDATPDVDKVEVQAK